MRAHTALYAALAILGLAAPFLGLYPVFLMKLLCFAMFACAFNLLLGYTKMLSFGHAAYFGSSAYVTGWLVTVHGWGTMQAILAGVAAAMLLGLAIGALAVRRQGIYFAMITLALSQLVFFVCLQAQFTGGENGLQGIPRGSIFGTISLGGDLTMYYFVLTLFVGVYALIRRIVHSPFGQVLKANPGQRTARGLSGLQGRPLQTAGLRPVGESRRFGRIAEGPGSRFRDALGCEPANLREVILMTLLGGSGTFLGPVVGSNIVVALEEYLSDLVGAWVSVIIGAIFVVCVMIFRRGFVGEIQRRYANRAGSAA